MFLYSLLRAATISPQLLPQEAPALVPLNVDQHEDLIREEIMRRILPRRPRIPVPQDRMIFHYLIIYTDFQKKYTNK